MGIETKYTRMRVDSNGWSDQTAECSIYEARLTNVNRWGREGEGGLGDQTLKVVLESDHRHEPGV
jgi:hypothetical protein